jgi:hypothetical protein
MTLISKIKALPIKQRFAISRSKKDFIILMPDNSYILTNDLVKHRTQYMKDGGLMGCLPTIKCEL